MKKCPDCGMVIANQAIRCPKCKYTFTSADESAGGNDSAVVTPQAAAVSAAATGKSDKVAGIMPMIEVNKDNVDTLYEQLKAAIVKRKTEFDHFIDFLENRTSWLTAPAEVKGSLACEKGLLIRSVSVAKQLLRIKDTIMPQLDEESAIIIALFHEVGKVGIEHMLALLAHGLDEVAAVVATAIVYEVCHDVRRETLAIAHDGRLRLGTQVVDEEYTIIYRSQLLKQFVERCEQRSSFLWVGDDSLHHVVVAFLHGFELVLPCLITFQG